MDLCLQAGLKRDLLLKKSGPLFLKSGPLFLKSGPFIVKVDLLAQNSGPFICEGGSSEPTEPPLATGLFSLHF